MATIDLTRLRFSLQSSGPTAYSDLAAILDTLTKEAQPLLDCLWAIRKNHRPGYPLKAMWRAYIASFMLNMAHTNELKRRLDAELELRRLCGFVDGVPARSTFNRFIKSVSKHNDLVESIFVRLTDQVRDYLPGLGKTVAVDATTVRSHCNPNRKRGKPSDPEASLTRKNSARAQGGKEWQFGFKAHMVACAKYGLPLALIVTTASQNDSPMLPKVIDHARATLSCMKPKVIIADRGYDSLANHNYAVGLGAIPIIHIRRLAKQKGIHTAKGVPTCIGGEAMVYIQDNADGQRLYRCPPEGCHLKGSFKGGGLHCRDFVWEDPAQDLRRFGVVRRDSPEWDRLYGLRQAIERIFKSLKESRRLERHCVRGLAQVTLHVLMSTITFQATALHRVRTGETRWMRWQVRKVA